MRANQVTAAKYGCTLRRRGWLEPASAGTLMMRPNTVSAERSRRAPTTKRDE